MKERIFWKNKIEQAWERKSILWLSGVRRVGKTCLCRSLDNVDYYDCELPSVRKQMENAELFLTSKNGGRLVLDEIHRLTNPSELLKIAADHFSDIKIIATGSSTLGASSKFGDTLTGRKTELWLTPMLLSESKIFGNKKIEHRLLHGGLPPFFMSKEFPEKEFLEWIDSYWAKDIQELFRLERRHSFQKFVELLFTQSGNIFEATRFTSPCEVSRTTISNYLSVLEATFVAHIVRPFNSHLPSEIISAPKVYGFDTGMICYAKSWHKLRTDDMGLLWEHCVLNELHGNLQTRNIYYWRDKRRHEIDFIYLKKRNRKEPIAIECKWSADTFNSKSLHIFRKHYPKGENFVVGFDVNESYQKQYDDIVVTFINIEDLIKLLQNH
ncbi:MAG: AAA family ATPase [Gammaproteobacteria bacterium]|jgi:predicted AAA+ superfamily ATPase